MPFSNDRLLAIHPGKTGTISESPGIRYSDAVHYHLPGGEAWVFDYGILVLWGVDFEERQALFQRLGMDNHLEELRQEQFRFVINAPATRISRDTRKTPRVFAHWPSDLATRHTSAGRDVMRAVLDAQLSTSEAPTRGQNADAAPDLAGGSTF